MDAIFPGDIVSCKIKDDFIIYNYIKQYDIITNFEVICLVIDKYQDGFLIKIPTNMFLKGSFTIKKPDIKEFSILPRFIDAEAHFITNSHIVAIKSKLDGIFCDNCKDFFQYATKDKSGKFRCFTCRTYR